MLYAVMGNGPTVGDLRAAILEIEQEGAASKRWVEWHRYNTLTELDRLAEPLHARVVTKEGLETTLRMTYEAGRASLGRRFR